VRSALAVLEEDGLIRRLPRQGIWIQDDARERIVGHSVPQHSVMFVRWTDNTSPLVFSQGVQRFLREHGDEAVIIDARESHEQFLDAIRHPPHGIRGMLLAPFEHAVYREAIRNAIDAGIRIVLIDRVFPDLDLPSVTTDNVHGGYLATDHLIRTHNRPVYFIGHIHGVTPGRDRHRGWKQAMEFHGFEPADRYVFVPSAQEYDMLAKIPEAHATWEANIAAVADLFRSGREEAYCVFAVNDIMALQVMDLARAAGLTIGKDVYLIGFDDCPFCLRQDPTLSSVVQQMERMGYEAAQLLYEALAGHLPKPIHKVLSVELRVRASSTGRAGREEEPRNSACTGAAG
jgi:DNA-binding LacI/PurR family transcriptional regulator